MQPLATAMMAWLSASTISYERRWCLVTIGLSECAWNVGLVSYALSGAEGESVLGGHAKRPRRTEAGGTICRELLAHKG